MIHVHLCFYRNGCQPEEQGMILNIYFIESVTYQVFFIAKILLRKVSGRKTKTLLNSF